MRRYLEVMQIILFLLKVLLTRFSICQWILATVITVAVPNGDFLFLSECICKLEFLCREDFHNLFNYLSSVDPSIFILLFRVTIEFHRFIIQALAMTLFQIASPVPSTTRFARLFPDPFLNQSFLQGAVIPFIGENY